MSNLKAEAVHESQLTWSELSRERLLVLWGETGLGGLLRLELFDAVECLGESESCSQETGRTPVSNNTKPEWLWVSEQQVTGFKGLHIFCLCPKIWRNFLCSEFLGKGVGIKSKLSNLLLTVGITDAGTRVQHLWDSRSLHITEGLFMSLSVQLQVACELQQLLPFCNLEPGMLFANWWNLHGARFITVFSMMLPEY